MPMNVISKRMGMGFAGQVARQSFNVIETHVCNSNAIPRYGKAVVMKNDGTVRVFQGSDTANDVYGIAVRPDAVQVDGTTNPSFTDSGNALKTQPVDVMVKGYINVKFVGDTQPVAGSKVYVLTAPTVGGTTGDFSTSDTGAVGPIPNAIFMGPADDNGIAQIRLL